MQKIARFQQILGYLLLVAGALYINFSYSGTTVEEVDPAEAINAIQIASLLLKAGLVFIVCGALATIWVLIKGQSLSLFTKALFVTSGLILLLFFSLQIYAR